MRTSIEESTEGRLLVDIEHGRVLRADDRVVVSQRYIDTHPFIRQGGSVVIAGPLDDDRCLEQEHYEIDREVAGSLHLQKIED